MVQCLVDIREREVLGLRQDLMAGGKFQHGSHCDRRSIGGTGHAALCHDCVHHLDRHWLEHRTDEMQPALRPERGDQRLPVEGNVHGHEHEVERARNRRELPGIPAAYHMMGTESAGFVGLVARGGEGGDLAAPGSRKFDCTWPSPPMPTTPTRSVGLTSNCCNGPNTVTPLQSSGPASYAFSSSGRVIAQGHCAHAIGEAALWWTWGSQVGRWSRVGEMVFDCSR